MTYQYTISYEDFKDAQRIFCHRSATSKMQFYFWNRVIPALGIVATVLLVRDVTFHHFSYRPAIGGALAGLAWIGLYMLACRPIQMRRLYKQMKNGRPDESPLEVAVEGDELVSRIPGSSEGRFRRKGVLSFLETNKMTLVFVAKKRFIIFPKRNLPETFFQELKDWFSMPVEDQA